MSALIYQTTDGKLRIGDSTDSEQVVNSIYRSRSGKKLIVRNEEFIEIDQHTKDEKRLFPTTPIRSPYGTRETRQVKRSTPAEALAGSIAHSRANR